MSEDQRVTEIRRLVADKRWSQALIERAINLRVPLSEIERWLRWMDDEEHVKRRIDWHERMTFGDLRGREAATAGGAYWTRARPCRTLVGGARGRPRRVDDGTERPPHRLRCGGPRR